MHAVLLGASRGCSYFAALNLLSKPEWSITLLLRNPSIITDDPKFKPYLVDGGDGRCRIVKGDATIVEDVKKCFEGVVVDVVVTSVGGAPAPIKSPSQVVRILTHGFELPIPDLTTSCCITLLTVLQGLQQEKVPRVVAVSTTGLGDRVKELPLKLRIIYKAIEQPHRDKLGLEYLLRRSCPLFPTPSTIPPIVPPAALPALRADSIPEVIIVQPGLLVDGEAKGGYRTGERVEGVWNVRRADVGVFLGEECCVGEKWVGKAVVIAY